jgi:hypothetical protein
MRFNSAQVHVIAINPVHRGGAVLIDTNVFEATELGVMEEIVENWQSLQEDEDAAKMSLHVAVQLFYGNALDELHDSRGDDVYQAETLEVIYLIEKMFANSGFITPTSAADLRAELPDGFPRRELIPDSDKREFAPVADPHWL